MAKPEDEAAKVERERGRKKYRLGENVGGLLSSSYRLSFSALFCQPLSPSSPSLFGDSDGRGEMKIRDSGSPPTKISTQKKPKEREEGRRKDEKKFAGKSPRAKPENGSKS